MPSAGRPCLRQAGFNLGLKRDIVAIEGTRRRKLGFKRESAPPTAAVLQAARQARRDDAGI